MTQFIEIRLVLLSTIKNRAGDTGHGEGKGVWPALRIYLSCEKILSNSSDVTITFCLAVHNRSTFGGFRLSSLECTSSDRIKQHYPFVLSCSSTGMPS